MVRKGFLVLLLMIVAHAPALAGLVVQMEVTHLDHAPPRRGQLVLSLQDDLLRVDTGIESGTAPDSSMIYRGDRKLMWVIDHRERRVTEVSEETLGRLAGQLSEMRKHLEEQMAQLPPEQRALIEKQQGMMGGGGGLPGGPADRMASLEIKKTSDRATRQGYPCVKYEAFRLGEKVRELWVTDWDRIGASPQTFDVLNDMGLFMQQNAAPFSAGLSRNHFAQLEKIEGVPVVIREFEKGRVISEAVLQSATERDVDAAVFEPPAGYKRGRMGIP